MSFAYPLVIVNSFDFEKFIMLSGKSKFIENMS